MNQVASDFQDAIGVNIDKHDFGREYVKIESGKAVKRYQDNEGAQLVFDDRNLVQTFGIMGNMRIVNGRVKNLCFGTTFLANASFVVLGFNDCSPVSFWKGLPIFRPGQCITTCAKNTDGDVVNLSGLIQDQGAHVETSPMTIAQKYFPEQIKQIQQNQIEIIALEISFSMLIENVCDLCLLAP